MTHEPPAATGPRADPVNQPANSPPVAASRRTGEAGRVGGPSRLAPPILLVGALLLLWEAATRLGGVPAWLLPAPTRVGATLVERFGVIAPQALVTLWEILAGFAAGTAAGVVAALVMARFAWLERALAPLLVASQAMPVFAIAPLLVVWLGFGLGSKVAMSGIIIFFPVASSFLEGLRRTDRGLVDLAQLYRATPLQRLWLIRVPAALPSLASGLRIAAAVAPIGAVVGEWVGASSGLGLLILHANARMQTDTVFAALLVLAMLSIVLWALVDALARRLVRWAPDTLHP
jgi:putative hydroxymethylpyrimidine transport system permease protein